MPARYSHVITVGLHIRAPWGLFCLVFGGFLAFPLGVETEWIDIYITLPFFFGDTVNLVRLCVCR
jgi:hypothetical protein